MTLRRRTRGCGAARSLLAAGVLLALCFSVGEGVRLIPFPDLRSSVASQKAESASARQPDSEPLLRYRFGRLDIPVKVQKRSKKQTDACEAALRTYPVAHVLPPAFSSERGSADLYSHPPAAFRPGRAPPRLSYTFAPYPNLALNHLARV